MVKKTVAVAKKRPYNLTSKRTRRKMGGYRRRRSDAGKHRAKKKS